MDIRLFLSKIIMLLYRTRELKIDSYDGLINTALDLLKVDGKEEQFLGANKTKSLVEFVHKLLNEYEELNEDVFISSLDVVLETDPKLLKTIKSAILKDLSETEIKGVISTLASEISSSIREEKLINIFNNYSSKIKFNRSSIPNVSNFIRDAIAELEPLATSSTSDEDPAVVREVSFDSPDGIQELYDDIKARNNESGIYVLGWQGLTRMCQGGIRPGEFVSIGALQHKYKTGATLSIFMQLARFNRPILTKSDVDKKPLIVWITFEDPLENNLQFMFQYLKANDGQILKPKEIDKFDTQEIARYVTKKMTATGFHIKMRRVDPSRWTYSDLFNYILELEAEGYSVKACFTDYLTMLPTTGCTQGPSGTDMRDLLRRTRNFMSARGIAFVTPLQLNPKAKELIRNGVPDVSLIKEIAEKGYYSGSAQLDQEIDLELYCHLATGNGKKYLTLGRGKHRLPTVLERDEDKFMILPFPQPNVPVLEDINGADTTLRSIPRASGGDSSMGGDLFSDLMG